MRSEKRCQPSKKSSSSLFPPTELERTSGLMARSVRSVRIGSSADGESSAAGDLVLPVDGRTDIEAALEHSIKLAKAYSARIVLVYVTDETVVPRGYAEYARAEKIRDYSPAYFSSLGETTIARLRRRIEDEGVECTGHAFVGSFTDAMKACQRDPRVLLLVLTRPRRSVLARLGIGGFRLGAISRLNVPIVFVPA